MSDIGVVLPHEARYCRHKLYVGLSVLPSVCSINLSWLCGLGYLGFTLVQTSASATYS